MHLSYTWVDSTAAVQVTLSEMEKEVRRGINDSVTAAPDDSSGFWCKKTIAESQEKEIKSWKLYWEDKTIGRVKSTTTAVINIIIIYSLNI